MTRVAATVMPAVPWETPDIETSSDDYARRFAGQTGAWMLKAQEQVVLRMLSAWPKASVLEVGGGHGQLTEALVREGHQVTVLGSDRSCQARIRPLIEAAQCRFITGNVLSLLCPANAFDVVVSVRLLPHVTAWPRLIGELTRAARHAVIVDYPTVSSLNVLTPFLFAAKQRVEGNTRTYRSFRDTEVASAFRAHRFACRGRVAQFFVPMVIHRMLRQPAVSAGAEAVCRALQLTRWFGSPVLALFVRGDA